MRAMEFLLEYERVATNYLGRTGEVRLQRSGIKFLLYGFEFTPTISIEEAGHGDRPLLLFNAFS
jgi:hypothetical protein